MVPEAGEPLELCIGLFPALSTAHLKNLYAMYYYQAGISLIIRKYKDVEVTESDAGYALIMSKVRWEQFFLQAQRIRRHVGTLPLVPLQTVN